eukprot:TRINITY_DN5984_c0_g2_i3.p1 TRINITY_DN5984_c0_g2~~TRINITY_DN5984_c0_g2_i3.p1  ORF type:complete len:546 (+),score=119.87 TRINITY_DN5984_c0_g2_i3:764-2401(+)
MVIDVVQGQSVAGFCGNVGDLMNLIEVRLESSDTGLRSSLSQFHATGGGDYRNSLTYEDDVSNEIVPLNENWNAGKIQIVINHCADCVSHKATTTSRHDEANYVEMFNDVGAMIKDFLPGCEIIGNWDPPNVLGGFEIYIRGVGPAWERDHEGRYWLFRNGDDPGLLSERRAKEGLPPFPRIKQVYDKICLLILQYGDSNDMEKYQETFLKTHARNFSRRCKLSHEFPANVPERQAVVAKKSEKPKIENGTQMICLNWTCGKTFSYDDNPMNVRSNCRHHPGRYEFGSIHGLWPESWTCCRRAWNAPGCRMGKHRGVPLANRLRLCLNHGDVNPRTEKPDSACGKAYPESNPGECKFHKGYLYVDRVTKIATWTCCSQEQTEKFTAESCYDAGNHEFAEWPDEKAKLYFVSKAIVNPGLYRDKELKDLNSWKNRATFTRYFVKTIAYQEYENPNLKALKKKMATEEEERYCLNWACEKSYKEIENKKKRTCKCHPGTYDFGHTGLTVSKATQDYLESLKPPVKGASKDGGTVYLWGPHWLSLIHI